MGNIVQVTDEQGNPAGAWAVVNGVSVFVRQQDLPAFMSQSGMMNGGGGGGLDIGGVADAAQGIYDLYSADAMREYANRAYRARRKLRDLRDELNNMPDSVGNAALRDKLVEIVDQQGKVDRAQTEAIEVGYKALQVDALAAGGRFVGRLQRGGMGGGFGGGGSWDGVLPVIAGVGLAALIFDDDDGRGRRGRF